MNFHYSTILHLPYILKAETLLPSRKEAHGNHRAGLLWFSTNIGMERTAYKSDVAPIRMGCSDAAIQPWRPIAQSIGYSNATMRRLEASGRKMGARPSDWQAMVGPLPLDRVETLEIYDARGWRELDRAALFVEGDECGVVQLFGVGGLAAIVSRQQTSEGYFAYATSSDSYAPRNLYSLRRQSA